MTVNAEREVVRGLRSSLTLSCLFSLFLLLEEEDQCDFDDLPPT